MNRRTSTSLFGNTGSVPSWVAQIQKNVYLSGFFNDLPQGLDVYKVPPGTGFTGQMYYNEDDRKLFIYSGFRWNDVGRQYNLSDQMSVTMALLSAAHTDASYVTLTKNHTTDRITVTAANSLTIDPGQSVTMEVVLIVRPAALTNATDAKTCKFFCAVSRPIDPSGIAVVTQDPVILMSNDVPFAVTCENGIIRIQVSCPRASTGSLWKSTAHCSCMYSLSRTDASGNYV